MKSLIIGHKGEVGGAMLKILKPVYPETYGIDLNEKDVPEGFKPDILHVCIRHVDDFDRTVRAYLLAYDPRILNICTTVSPGTTERFGPFACHSTTRGAHPNLDAGLRNIPKHISGPKAEKLAAYFRKAGVPCVTDPNPRTTEVNHDLNNLHLGINLVFAEMASRYSRRHGTDFIDYLNYTQTNNAGFSALGHESKVRPVLTPPNGRIGGHCVVPSAKRVLKHMDPSDPLRQLVELVATFNDAKA